MALRLTKKNPGADKDTECILSRNRAVLGRVLMIPLRDRSGLHRRHLARLGAAEAGKLEGIGPAGLRISDALVEEDHGGVVGDVGQGEVRVHADKTRLPGDV